MPRIKSSKKRMRQAQAASTRNRAQRSALRTAMKKVRVAGSKADAQSAYQRATKLLDRAARKNLVHPNAAARQKSRLAKAVADREG